MHNINCQHCKGHGIIGHGEDKAPCPECDGKGYRLIDKKIYFRNLLWDQKNRKEKEK